LWFVFRARDRPSIENRRAHSPEKGETRGAIFTCFFRFCYGRLLRESQLPGWQVLSPGPESDATLRHVRHHLSTGHVAVQAGVRVRRPDVPELVSPATSRLSDGQGHTNSLQGTVQEWVCRKNKYENLSLKTNFRARSAARGVRSLTS